MAVEADAIGEGLGDGFTDVVEENAPGEGGFSGAEEFHHAESVDPDVAFRVVLGGLGDALHGFDFGEKFGEEAGLIEEFEAAVGVAVGEDAGEFGEDAFGGDFADGERVDGGEGGGVDLEVEAGGEADGPEHAEVVFGEAGDGVADGTDEAGGEVGATVDEVEDFAGEGVEEETVDREVAPLGVGGGVGFVLN